MSSIDVPVDSTDSIYRRLPSNWRSKEGNISFVSFRPRTSRDGDGSNPDNDGLSVDLKSLVASPEETSRRWGRTVGVARVLVDTMRRHQQAEDGRPVLDVIRNPIEGNDAHALIPAVNSVDYERDKPSKNRVLAYCDALARMAEVVVEPPPVASA